MSSNVYFNIHPHHELATVAVAVIVVKEMIAAKHKYGVVQGCERSTNKQFHSVLPASIKEPNAVGLKTWLKTYQNAKPKASKS